MFFEQRVFYFLTVINKKKVCVKIFNICIYLEIIHIALKGGHYYAIHCPLEKLPCN